MKTIETRPAFCRNLVRLRKERHLTQEDLARLTGLTKRMIAYYETEAINPPLDKVEVLAQAMNVKIDELIGTHDLTPMQQEFIGLDGRTLKQLKKILELSAEQRHIVYQLVDSLITKKKPKK